MQTLNKPEPQAQRIGDALEVVSPENPHAWVASEEYVALADNR